jgi:hypothetical protein
MEEESKIQTDPPPRGRDSIEKPVVTIKLPAVIDLKIDLNGSLQASLIPTNKTLSFWRPLRGRS